MRRSRRGRPGRALPVRGGDAQEEGEGLEGARGSRVLVVARSGDLRGEVGVGVKPNSSLYI